SGIAPRTGWVGEDGGAEFVIRIQISAAHTLIDHLLYSHLSVPAHIHADLQEHRYDAGVLAYRAMALGAHARVDQNLRHGIARGGRFLQLIRASEITNVVRRMIVADVLECVGHALDEVVLPDCRHCSHYMSRAESSGCEESSKLQQCTQQRARTH